MTDIQAEEDILFEPIAGVDLKTYARVCAVLLTRGATGPEAGAIVTALGIPVLAWSEARIGWARRIASDEAIRDAYAEYYRRARGRATRQA